MGSVTAIHPVVRALREPSGAASSEVADRPQVGLDITHRGHPGTAGRIALVLTGELCVASVVAVRPILAELAASGSVMTIDLAGATLVGAAAMGMFVELDADLGRRGGGLELRHPDQLTTRVLTIGQLQRFLPSPPTEDDLR